MHIVQNNKRLQSCYDVSAKKIFKTSIALSLPCLNRVQHKNYMERYNGGKDARPSPTSFC